ncbi:hypothetical protein, partial [Mycoplasma marinum]
MKTKQKIILKTTLLSAILTVSTASIVVSCGKTENKNFNQKKRDTKDVNTHEPKNITKKENPKELNEKNLELIKKSLMKKPYIKEKGKDAKEIAKKIENVDSLKEELGLDLTKIKGSKVTVSAKGDNKGDITVYIQLTTKGFPGTPSPVIEKVINEEKVNIVTSNEIQANNIALLKTILNDATTIKVPTDKASVIASRITDAAKLKDELGIDLTFINGSTFAISATGATDGTISISVTMTTAGTTTPDSNALTKDVQQLSDTELDANKLQKNNFDTLKTILNGSPTIKVPTNKASAIASKITDVASLKDQLGIDLTSINGNGSTFVVSATGATDGTISISVTMTTSGATTPDSTALTKDVQQLSDAELDANKLQKNNFDTLKTILNGSATIKVPTNKASAIASKIT